MILRAENLKFVYSEKATSKVEISQNFVAFLEYKNFNVIIITMAAQFIYNFQSPVTFWLNRQKYK